MKRGIVTILFAIVSLVRADKFEYCCVKKHRRGWLNAKSDCQRYQADRKLNRDVEIDCKKKKVIGKDKNPDLFTQCCGTLQIGKDDRCLVKGCYSGSMTIEEFKQEPTMNPLHDPQKASDEQTGDSTKTGAVVSGPKRSISETSAPESNTDISTTSEEELPQFVVPNCVSSSGYLIRDCVASFQNRKYQDQINFHFRRYDGTTTGRMKTQGKFLALPKEEDEVRGEPEEACGAGYNIDDVEKQRALYCGMHAINNVLIREPEKRVKEIQMMHSVNNILQSIGIKSLMKGKDALYTPNVGSYSIYVVGDALSRATGFTVHQYSTKNSRFVDLGATAMMKNLRDHKKNLVVHSGAHYIALNYMETGDWCFVESLYGGKLRKMTDGQVSDYLMSSKVSAFLTVSLEPDNAPPFRGAQETYASGSSLLPPVINLGAQEADDPTVTEEQKSKDDGDSPPLELELSNTQQKPDDLKLNGNVMNEAVEE